MNYFVKFLSVFVLLISQVAVANPTLPQGVVNRMYGATFEVVVKKIDKDSLTYKEPLPTHLIPYQTRTDKYWSIGTAFAIGPNTFVSAAHVFDLKSESLYTDFYLRDTKGKVYKMGKVSKFIDNRDMIVFTLKLHRVKNHLQTNTSPSLNSKVFAVGNAHGEGVIIRDGLYTSNTPEERDGKWSWIRFSAAASPGNSGGPLLDEKGRVIGIVLRKSKNENLNYALPISEVLNAKKNLAVIDTRMKYFLDNLKIEKIADFKHKIKLPLSFNKLNKKLITASDKFSDTLMHKMLAENKKNIFPHNKNSEDMLHRNYSAMFPNIIWQKKDGNWAPFKPNEINSAKLEKNGFLQYGKLGDNIIFRIRKPDNANLKGFLKDGKLMMDYLLRAINYERNVGGKNIRITSLGKPVSTKKFKDNFDRKWIIRKWHIEYDDSAIVTMTLPTPGGSVTLMRSSGLGRINSHLADLKVIADYAYISYYGTLKQWTEYLALRDQLPKAMKSIKLKYRPGKRFAFGSSEVMMTFDTSVQKITDSSDLKLYFSYFKRKNKVVWDLVSVSVGEDKNTDNVFQVVRNPRPSDNMSDDHKNKWTRLVQQDFPFNKVSYFKNKGTHIGTVYTRGKSDAQLKNKKILYSVFHTIEGKKEETEVKKRINAFIHGLKIPNV